MPKPYESLVDKHGKSLINEFLKYIDDLYKSGGSLNWVETVIKMTPQEFNEYKNQRLMHGHRDFYL